MLILAIDTETSGLVPAGAEKGSAEYPWIVSIGAALFDDAGADRGLLHTRVKADGRVISSGAQGVHGIDSRMAGRGGISEVAMLGTVCGMAAQASILTGYNAAFDVGVLESSLLRLGRSTRMLIRPGLQVVDLMEPSAAACKLPPAYGGGSHRWPSLDTACQVILGEPARDGLHDALADAMRAKRLFLALRDRGLIEMEAAA